MTVTLPLLPALPSEVVPGVPGTGELRSESGAVLPLRSVSLDVEVSGLFASSTLRQRFENTGTEPIEAVYVFPLPSRGAVTRFTAELGGRTIIGRLEERGKAREEYDAAVAAGQRAALAEEDRPEVFTVTVGNLLPGEEASVELLVTQPLPVEEGTGTFRFPLVVAPRYTSGAPLPGDQVGDGTALDTDQVPDASRVTPPRFQDGDVRPEVTISVSFEAGFPYDNLRSSLHAVTTDTSDGLTRLFVSAGERLDRDLVVSFDLPADRLLSTAVVSPDPEPVTDGGAGTWSVTVVAPPAVRTPRDVVVVLDRSGSMGGWKMVAARRAAARIVDTLDLADRFAVLGFDTVAETAPSLGEQLREASDRNRFSAVSWLSGLDARGGTEMLTPLGVASGLLSDQGRTRSVVLVTDGQVSGEDQIVKMFAGTGIRVFSVGIDRAVNASLLQRLADVSGGLSYLVESEDRLDTALQSVSRTVGTPSLLDVTVSADGLVPGMVSPGGSLDLFAGVPFTLSGRFDTVPGMFKVTARTPSGEPFELTLAPEVTSVPAVTASWARSRVRDLEDRALSAPYQPGRELVDAVVEHSLRYQVLSRYTAFVAIDPEDTGAESMRRTVQPVESPSGWAATMMVGATSRGGSMAMGAMRGGVVTNSADSGALYGAPYAAPLMAAAPAPAAATWAAPAPSAGSWSGTSVPPPPALSRPLLMVANEVRAALEADDRQALSTLLVELSAAPVSGPSASDRAALSTALQDFLSGLPGAREQLEALLSRILVPVAPSTRRSRPFWKI